MGQRVDEFDLIVAGSGAAGLSAAVAAADAGLRVLVAEKAATLGGTTAWSGGWVFAPRTHVARANGVDEPAEAPLTYLREALGEFFDDERVRAFLSAAPHMVAFLEQAGVRWELGRHIPDTYGHLPSAGTGGRSVIAAPFDARMLKNLGPLLRPPMRETTFRGMTIQAGADLRAFMTMTQSFRSFGYVARRVLQHLIDVGLHGRGMQLRNGQALVGRLLSAAAERGVTFRLDAPVESLIHHRGRVVGAVLGRTGGGAVAAPRGVVLASGGFPHDAARRAILFSANRQHRTLAVPEAVGDGARLGEAAGGHVVHGAATGAWCPVSEVRYPNGSKGLFPHIIERGKPGLIAVRRNGRRFCNEGIGYHDYVEALFRATPFGEEAVSWLVCTRAFQRRYGLGIARPRPLPEHPWIRSGYIKMGKSPEMLAQACGINPEELAATISAYNVHARRGEDPEFGRGSTLYQRYQGDPNHKPNPCVAPLEPGPYYAVRVIPGSFGTFAGLATDACARVLGSDGPIPGLWAAGADMANVMGGHYPAGGINLGPALTFGWLAGRDAAGLKPEALV